MLSLIFQKLAKIATTLYNQKLFFKYINVKKLTYTIYVTYVCILNI